MMGIMRAITSNLMCTRVLKILAEVVTSIRIQVFKVKDRETQQVNAGV